MVSAALINRLITTSRDFDASGLDVISYYLRFYAVEEILCDESRPGEITELATELLNSVEEYKNSVEAGNEDDKNNATYILIHDQEKAKVYLSNFAMSLYNGKLQQVQKGPWDVNLRRGLWCCIDLFSCIIHLWDDPDGSYKKRIKYCKLYLSKLAKGQLGENMTKSEQPDPAVSKVSDTELNNYVEKVNHDLSDSTEDQRSREGVEEPESTPVQLDYNDFMEQEDALAPSDDEISNMLDRLRAKEEEEEKLNSNYEEERGEDASFALPEVPVQLPSEATPKEIPQFLDSEDEYDMEQESDKENAKVEEKKEVTPPKAHTRKELNDMMDTASKIEKIQRMAKYAISALNYEDIATAKDELTNALEVLNSIG